MSEGNDDNGKEPDVTNVTASLRNFSQAAYRNIAWEIAEGVGPQMLFEPLEVQTLENQRSLEDPFFQDFESGNPKRKSLYLGPTDKMGQVQQAPTPDITAQLEQRFKEGIEEGIAQGRAAVLLEVEEQKKAEQAKVETFFKSVNEQLKNFFANVEKQALKFSLDVSRELLQATAELKPEYILDVIRQGLKATGSATPLKLRVSVADYEFLNIEGLPSDLTSEELGIEYVADESIQSGCIIETDYGDVDLQLESMWQQMRESLREVFQ